MTVQLNSEYIPSSLYDANGQLKVSDAQAQKIAEGVAARLKDMPPAKAEVFLAMMKTADMAPSGKTGDADVNATLDRFALAAEMVNSIVYDSELTFLARVMIQQAGLERQMTVAEVMEARKQAQALLKAAAGESKEQADKMIAGAVTSLVLTTVSSAVAVMGSGAQIGGAGVSAFKTLKTGGYKDVAAGLGLNKSDAAQFAASKTQNLNSITGGLGTAGQTVDKYGSATAGSAQQFTGADVKVSEGQQSELNAAAENQKSEADRKKEFQQMFDEMIKAIISLLASLGDAKAQQMAALTKA